LDTRCDNCRKNNFPVFFRIRLFGKTWNICPVCVRHAIYLLKNNAVRIVE
jgi:hypothetical protein